MTRSAMDEPFHEFEKEGFAPLAAAFYRQARADDLVAGAPSPGNHETRY